ERATFSENQDNLNTQTHQYKKDPTEQVVIAAVAIALSIVTYGAASALIGSMASAGAGSGGFFAAAGATAGSAGAGLGNIVLASAISGMAANTATQLLATGSVDVGNVLKAGLTSGLTAGLTRGIGHAIGNQTLGTSREIAGSTGNLVKAGAATTDLGDKIVGYTIRAAVTGGANQAVYGDDVGSFGTAFINSWVASSAADAASWVGDTVDRQENPVGNIAAHAAVGCAAAAATGGSCGAGALGAAAAATINPILDQFTSAESLTARNAQLAAATTAVSGLIAAGLGTEADTAIATAQNETLNNYLSSSQKTAMLRDLEQCTNIVCVARVQVAWSITSKQQDIGLLVGVGGGLGYGGYEIARGIVELMAHLPQTLQALSSFVNDPNVRTAAIDATFAGYEERIIRLAKAYEDAGWDGSVSAGVELGRLIFDIAGTAAAVGGAAKLGAQLATIGGKAVTNVAERVANVRPNLSATLAKAEVRVRAGVELNAKLPDPVVGPDYTPQMLRAGTENNVWSHFVAYQTELRVANEIADLPGHVVVRYGDAIGKNGADIISVNSRTGTVYLWDAKYRSNPANLGESSTFTNPNSLNNAIQDATTAIRNAGNLTPVMKQQALDNLASRTFETRTVAQGVVTQSTLSTFVNGVKK
ncbi:MAG: hypothetical protein E4H01_06525, partial [Lysobacterales bacterium]